MIAATTVFFFSLVQSLFGMGLLVFGTPTLLLLGFDFPQALAILLPASITISCLQLLEGWLIERRFAKQFILWCLPSLALGLAALIRYSPTISLELVLGLLMLTFASFQLVPRLSVRARGLVRQNSSAWMVFMGMVHGISNLGGSVLSVVASAHFDEKVEIRRTVAFCYLCFAGVQLLILFLFKPEIFGWHHLLVMAIAGTVYLALGRRTFAILPQVAFERLFLAFMFAYALVLCSRGVGLV